MNAMAAWAAITAPPHFRQALNGIIDELYEMYKKNGADLNKEVLPVKKEGISLRKLDFLS